MNNLFCGRGSKGVKGKCQRVQSCNPCTHTVRLCLQASLLNENDAMRYANVSHDNVMVGSGPASNVRYFQRVVCLPFLLKHEYISCQVFYKKMGHHWFG